MRDWFKSTSGRIWLSAPFVLWAIYRFSVGDIRWEVGLLAVIVPLLAFGGTRAQRLFFGLYPMGLLGLTYDAMRFVKNVGLTPERIHICDLRALDMTIASTWVHGSRGTVHDWLQAHATTTLDVACAIPYGTFLFAAIGFAVFLFVKDYSRMQLFAWSFLLVNLAGFITYHLYPAAPPWYFHAHGCVADLSSHASEGPNLARVDALFGFHYFSSMYGRSNDVFGAVPSLHVAYPMLVLLYGWPILKTPGRMLSILFLVSMCFAAVYLDHHWILDVIVGLTYTSVVFFVLRLSSRPSVSAERIPALA